MTRLREKREEKEMSVSELSRRSGVSRQTIHRLEEEKIDTANAKTLKSLADALDVKVTEFFAE